MKRLDQAIKQLKEISDIAENKELLSEIEVVLDNARNDADCDEAFGEVFKQLEHLVQLLSSSAEALTMATNSIRLINKNMS